MASILCLLLLLCSVTLQMVRRASQVSLAELGMSAPIKVALTSSEHSARNSTGRLPPGPILRNKQWKELLPMPAIWHNSLDDKASPAISEIALSSFRRFWSLRQKSIRVDSSSTSRKLWPTTTGLLGREKLEHWMMGKPTAVTSTHALNCLSSPTACGNSMLRLWVLELEHPLRAPSNLRRAGCSGRLSLAFCPVSSEPWLALVCFACWRTRMPKIAFPMSVGLMNSSTSILFLKASAHVRAIFLAAMRMLAASDEL